MKNKEKKFDAVKMMREIRECLHKEYEKNPEKRIEDLKRVHQQYIQSDKSLKL